MPYRARSTNAPPPPAVAVPPPTLLIAATPLPAPELEVATELTPPAPPATPATPAINWEVSTGSRRGYGYEAAARSSPLPASRTTAAAPKPAWAARRALISSAPSQRLTV